jgi:arginyl-tRNA synthetase
MSRSPRADHRRAERPRVLPRLRGVTPAALADLVRSFADDVLTRRGLDPAVLPATVTVEHSRNRDHGDYATSVALQAAGPAGVAPSEFAGWLAEALSDAPGLDSAEVAGPGFVNLRLAACAYGWTVRDVLAAGERYGADEELAAQLGLRVDQVFAEAEPRIGAGTVHELGELLGADTVRYALIRASGEREQAFDLDPALWSTHTDRNPVYPVQYAHARLTALIRNAVDLGVEALDAQLELLGHEREGELIRMLGELPGVATSAAESGRVALLARYLEQLAKACHLFADNCPVLPVGDEDPRPRHAARLALCRAARQVLANGMRLLGVTALEQL